MVFDERRSAQTGERRRSGRQDARSAVHLTVETRELRGLADNISPSGILFFSEGDLRVTIEFEQAGESRKLAGRLVRAQRMRGDQIGWAVEFDPS